MASVKVRGRCCTFNFQSNSYSRILHLRELPRLSNAHKSDKTFRTKAYTATQITLLEKQEGKGTQHPALNTSPTMDPNKSLEKPKHERKVSWGTMVTTLRKEKQQDQSSNKKLNLSDVISSKPAENESVTHFMKSIDKVPSSKDNEEDPETESLYRDIAAEELSHDASSTKNVQEDEEPAAAAPAALSVASSHQQSQFSLGSGGPGSNKAKFKSLVKRHIIASKDAHSTIFGLAAAMKEMEEEERKMNGNDESNSNDGSDGGDVESQGQTHESDSNESANDVENPGATGNKGSKNKKKKHHHFRNGVANGFEHNVTMFKKFVGNKKDKLYSYLKKVILFIMLPSLAISVRFVLL